MKQSTDGRDSVKTALKELKACGYYDKNPVKDAAGRIVGWDGIVREVPVCADETHGLELDNHVDNLDNTVDNSDISVDNCVDNSPQTDFPLMENQPQTDFATAEKPEVEKPLVENPVRSNNDFSNGNSA